MTDRDPKFRPTLRIEALHRARSMVEKKIAYSLGAGGRDPWDDDPATMRIGDPGAVCDCSGFVAWVLGFDRKQTPAAFPEYGGWINTDSMISEARRRSTRSGVGWFGEHDWPDVDAEPGDLIVYGSVRNGAGGRTPGHVGIIVGVSPNAAGMLTVQQRIVAMSVIHCSSGNSRRNKGCSVQETSGGLWAKKSHAILRYLRYLPEGKR